VPLFLLLWWLRGGENRKQKAESRKQKADLKAEEKAENGNGFGKQKAEG
jgi:hypothetical protein